jgi:hypothetical protein
MTESYARTAFFEGARLGCPITCPEQAPNKVRRASNGSARCWQMWDSARFAFAGEVLYQGTTNGCPISARCWQMWECTALTGRLRIRARLYSLPKTRRPPQKKPNPQPPAPARQVHPIARSYASHRVLRYNQIPDCNSSVPFLEPKRNGLSARLRFCRRAATAAGNSFAVRRKFAVRQKSVRMQGTPSKACPERSVERRGVEGVPYPQHRNGA